MKQMHLRMVVVLRGTCPEQHWAPGWMALLSFLFVCILGQGAGLTQPPWSWDMPAVPSAIRGWKCPGASLWHCKSYFRKKERCKL